MAFVEKFDGLELPAAADFHVHVRDGDMSKVVVPTIRLGGVNTAYVMPNLVPPVTTVSAALAYKSRLEAIDPSIKYLMTLYLHPSITPETVREAAAAGIVGIKSYPAGVTTNSSSGVLSYEPFYPVFEAMEESGLVLNLHGECPSDHAKDITILNAESSFLPTLKSLHQRFPKLRIVLEHCTTAAAVQAVQECGPTVVGTITAHHLYLVIDDWAADGFNFCKPVAKTPSDRTALIHAAISGSPKFFLGTDSAPHPITAKQGSSTAAGVYTQPHAVGYVLGALSEAVDKAIIPLSAITPAILENFLCTFGRDFYRVPDTTGERIVLRHRSEVVSASYAGFGIEVVPFRRGLPVWSVSWK